MPPLFAAPPLPASVIAALRTAIRAGTGLDANPTSLGPGHLAAWFDAYDAAFFAGRVREMLTACQSPLTFDVSPRLTRSGGLTKQHRPRGTRVRPMLPQARYQISLSGPLLMGSFQDLTRKVVVNGLECADRLDAALRIFEHEVLHLIEMLEAGRSSCSAAPFKRAARAYFGHTHTKHDLVTQNERAREVHDVKVGDRVRFPFDGGERIGVLNRITRRATVLVEDPRGERYRDGRRYLKFYVPLGLLRRV